MIYKLIGNNNKNNVIEQILTNRGIDNPHEYINVRESCCDSYECLDNIHQAVDCFTSHVERRDDIGILVDPDV